MPPPKRLKEINFEYLSRALRTAKTAFRYFVLGVPIIRGKGKVVHVEFPVMYMDVAIDRIHYDPFIRGHRRKADM